MIRRSATLAIPAVGATTQGPRTAIATPDDAKTRHVVGVKASLVTKGMEFTFDINTAPQVVVDAAVLGQLTNVMLVAYDVPVNVQLSFSVNNTTGAALVAGDFVTIVYEVDS